MPLSQFVGEVPVSAEANSGASLWEQHRPSQSPFTRDLYARSAEGAFNLIGQINVPFGEEEQESDYMYRFTHHLDVPFAATHDYGHVIVHGAGLENHLALDTETLGQVSLYEFSGLGNPPVLVDAEGGKGSWRVVSQCGAELGSGSSGSAFNAFSADGETVFFTAEPAIECGGRAPATAEVYARLHGSALSGLPAEAVDVSASECTEVCGGESSKNFEGASEDGKIAYFTSTQKLTNDAVDGVASGEAYKGGCARTEPENGKGCNLYVFDFNDPSAACQEAPHRCLSLVATGGEVLGVVGIAEDGQRVYYVQRHEEEPGVYVPYLYVYDLATHSSTLITHLSNSDRQVWAKRFFRPAEVAGEGGRFLLFASSMPGLTADQEGSVEQLFEYDAVTGELVRVSKGEDGYNQNGNGVKVGISSESIAELMVFYGLLEDFKATTNPLTVSGDGRTVVFRTEGRLSPFATSAERCISVYEFHTGGLLSEGQVHLLSDGRDESNIPGVGCGAMLYSGAVMDGSGGNVLFGTGDGLVSGDVDGGQRDLYDARSGGGFASELSGVCGGEGCVTPAAGVGPGFGPEGSVVQAPEPASVVRASSSAKPKSKAKSKSKPRGKRKRRRRVRGRKAGLSVRVGVGGGVR